MVSFYIAFVVVKAVKDQIRPVSKSKSSTSATVVWNRIDYNNEISFASYTQK